MVDDSNKKTADVQGETDMQIGKEINSQVPPPPYF